SLPPQASFNDSLDLEVDVALNGLDAGDLRVECVVRRELCSELTVPVRQYADRGSVEYGVRNIGGEPVFVEAFSATGTEHGRGRFRIAFRPPWCGALGLSVRVVPWHPQLGHPYEMGLMRWLDVG